MAAVATVEALWAATATAAPGVAVTEYFDLLT